MPAPSPGRLLGRAASNVALALRDAFAWPIARFAPRDWLVLRLDHGLSDAPPAGPGWLQPLSRPRCTAHVLEALAAAARDPRLRGVIARSGLDGLGWGQAVEPADALAGLRAAGKRLVVYAEQTGNAGAWLGGLAERFWMTRRAGSISWACAATRSSCAAASSASGSARTCSPRATTRARANRSRATR